jgi:DNA repair exonuclease SbcCD nuclease subunit
VLKLAYITDVHIRTTTPARRKDDYPSTVKTKLLEVRKVCEERDVDALLIGGDLYDSSSPSPQAVSIVLDCFKGVSFPILAILGNHEMLGHNKSSVSQRMIGLLSRFENDYPVKILEGGFDRPSYTFECGVEIWALHYEYGIEDRLKEWEPRKQSNGVLMAHANIVEKPAVFPDHVLFNEVKSPARVILCSHYHKKQGVKEANGCLFVSPGALTRGTISIDDLNRTPALAFIEYDANMNVRCTLEDLKCALPPEEVFDLVEVEKERGSEARLKEFIETIRISQQAGGGHCKLEEIIARVKGVEEKVIKRALQALERSTK